MPKQDPRVTPDALEAIEDFFISLARRNNAQVKKALELDPTLIYARDENGNTALNGLILSGTRESLETARVVISAARVQGFEADVKLKSNQGADCERALKTIKDPGLRGEFTNLINTIPQAPLDIAAELRAIESHKAELRAGNEAYFDRAEVKEGQKTIKKIEESGDKKCTIMCVREITYDKELKDIFGKLEPLNFDQQKEINRMNEEVNAQLQRFSFHSIGRASEDDLSIIVMPTIAQLKDFVEKALDFIGYSAHALEE
jgi:hypothetical protein